MNAANDFNNQNKGKAPSAPTVKMTDGTNVGNGNRDAWGRDTTGWIEIGGKLRPHP